MARDGRDAAGGAPAVGYGREAPASMTTHGLFLKAPTFTGACLDARGVVASGDVRT
jgi:hypothetical protein